MKRNQATQPAAYRLVRSNRKTVAIQIEPDGEVVVRAPRRLPVGEVEFLLQQKANWVARKQQEVRQRALAHPAPVLRTGEGLPFLGRTLMAVPGAGVDVERVGEVLMLPATNLEAALRRWYRAQALAVLTARTAELAARHGISYASVTVTDARRRWGSCGADGRIHYSWRLILAAPEAIDYVVVHELCHRLELNHSPAFWAQVAALLPDWQERERWLRDHGGLLRLFQNNPK